MPQDTMEKKTTKELLQNMFCIYPNLGNSRVLSPFPAHSNIPLLLTQFSFFSEVEVSFDPDSLFELILKALYAKEWDLPFFSEVSVFAVAYASPHCPSFRS